MNLTMSSLGLFMAFIFGIVPGISIMTIMIVWLIKNQGKLDFIDE